MSEPSTPAPQDDLLHILRAAVVNEVRAEDTDLSLRQMAVLLTVHLTDEPQTMRGLAAHLDVARSVITRALDRLGDLDLVRRKVDPADRRSVIARRTPNGTAMMKRLMAAMVEAGAAGLRKASGEPAA
jgi:DNA-binding MarR family transcriptional regulator